MTKRTPALWTPWGEVLCTTCHGSVQWNGKDVTVPEQQGENDERGFCTKCGKPVWVLRRSDVAMLTRLRRKMGEGNMEQTGGMCVALSFRRADDGYVIATVEEEFVLGLYTKDGWEDSGEALEIASYPVTPSLDKAIAGIRKMLNAVIGKEN